MFDTGIQRTKTPIFTIPCRFIPQWPMHSHSLSIYTVHPYPQSNRRDSMRLQGQENGMIGWGPCGMKRAFEGSVLGEDLRVPLASIHTVSCSIRSLRPRLVRFIELGLPPFDARQPNTHNRDSIESLWLVHMPGIIPQTLTCNTLLRTRVLQRTPIRPVPLFHQRRQIPLLFAISHPLRSHTTDLRFLYCKVVSNCARQHQHRYASAVLL